MDRFDRKPGMTCPCTPPIPRPCRKPEPDPCCAFLMPCILACGKEHLRRCFCLTLDLPACAQPPYTLISVSAGCTAPRAVPDPHGCILGKALRVTLPLTCQVRDTGGCIHTSVAEIDVSIALRPVSHTSDLACGQLILQPGVRLLCAPPSSCDPCFDAQLDVCLDAYLVQWKPFKPASKKECTC